MGSKSSKESTEFDTLFCNRLIAREDFFIESIETIISIFCSRRGNIVYMSDGEGTALRDEERVWAWEVADSGVVDSGDRFDFTFEGLSEGFGVASHVADEDDEAVGFGLGGDDTIGTLHGEGEGLFDHYVFAGFEGCDCVWFVEFVASEDEDDIDVWTLEDIVGVARCQRYVEFRSAVLGGVFK